MPRNFIFKKWKRYFIISLVCFLQSFFVYAKVTEQNSNYLIEEYYSTKDDALDACHNFAEKHGYVVSACNETSGNYNAGWLWAKYPTVISPMELGVFITI
jgi:hypothetical protein